MASSAMVKYLARVAREAREERGRKPFHIAYTPPGIPSVDPATVWRFENDEAWPRNPDRMVDRYASELGIEPFELWSRALELWRADALTRSAEALRPDAGEASSRSEAVGGLAASLEETGESPQRKERAQPRSARKGSRRGRA